MNIYDMTPEQQVEFALSHAHEGLRKAAEMRSVTLQQKQASKAVIPGLVDTLIDGEFITKEKRAEAVKSLSNPVDCLTLFKKFAEVAIPKDRAYVHNFGEPIKSASYTSVVGRNGGDSEALATWNSFGSNF